MTVSVEFEDGEPDILLSENAKWTIDDERALVVDTISGHLKEVTEEERAEVQKLDFVEEIGVSDEFEDSSWE